MSEADQYTAEKVKDVIKTISEKNLVLDEKVANLELQFSEKNSAVVKLDDKVAVLEYQVAHKDNATSNLEDQVDGLASQL